MNTKKQTSKKGKREGTFEVKKRLSISSRKPVSFETLLGEIEMSEIRQATEDMNCRELAELQDAMAEQVRLYNGLLGHDGVYLETRRYWEFKKACVLEQLEELYEVMQERIIW